MTRILVVEDEKLLRWSLQEHLSGLDHEVLAVENGKLARNAFREGRPDLVLLDIKLPDANGIDLLQHFRREDPHVPILIMTGHGGVEIAIEAMRLGADDYIDKPFNMDELSVKVAKALERNRLYLELKDLRRRSGQNTGFGDMIAESPGMQTVVEMMHKICRSPSSTVLLQGESGTGKDVCARAIHSGSARADKPFVNITCSALADTLLESELFGHEKGAFTDARERKKGLLELADEGSVFLDEITETSLSFQAKLLRFLEERQFKTVGGIKDIRVNVRVIAASNRDLEQHVRNGKFREDLFFRLNVLPLKIPPLRERSEDILPLTNHFIHKLSVELAQKARRLDDSAKRALRDHPWPGNIRELRNVVERALILTSHPVLSGADFGLAGSTGGLGSPGLYLPPDGLDFEQDVEKRYVELALRITHGNQGAAAKLLGMNRDQIRYRIKKFNLASPKDGSEAS